MGPIRSLLRLLGRGPDETAETVKQASVEDEKPTLERESSRVSRSSRHSRSSRSTPEMDSKRVGWIDNTGAGDISRKMRDSQLTSFGGEDRYVGDRAPAMEAGVSPWNPKDVRVSINVENASRKPSFRHSRHRSSETVPDLDSDVPARKRSMPVHRIRSIRHPFSNNKSTSDGNNDSSKKLEPADDYADDDYVTFSSRVKRTNKSLSLFRFINSASNRGNDRKTEKEGIMFLSLNNERLEELNNIVVKPSGPDEQAVSLDLSAFQDVGQNNESSRALLNVLPISQEAHEDRVNETDAPQKRSTQRFSMKLRMDSIHSDVFQMVDSRIFDLDGEFTTEEVNGFFKYVESQDIACSSNLSSISTIAILVEDLDEEVEPENSLANEDLSNTPEGDSDEFVSARSLSPQEPLSPSHIDEQISAKSFKAKMSDVTEQSKSENPLSDPPSNEEYPKPDSFSSRKRHPFLRLRGYQEFDQSLFQDDNDSSDQGVNSKKNILLLKRAKAEKKSLFDIEHSSMTDNPLDTSFLKRGRFRRAANVSSSGQNTTSDDNLNQMSKTVPGRVDATKHSSAKNGTMGAWRKHSFEKKKTPRSREQHMEDIERLAPHFSLVSERDSESAPVA